MGTLAESVPSGGTSVVTTATDWAVSRKNWRSWSRVRSMDEVVKFRWHFWFFLDAQRRTDPKHVENMAGPYVIKKWRPCLCTSV